MSVRVGKEIQEMLHDALKYVVGGEIHAEARRTKRYSRIAIASCGLDNLLAAIC